MTGKITELVNGGKRTFGSYTVVHCDNGKYGIEGADLPPARGRYRTLDMAIETAIAMHTEDAANQYLDEILDPELA